MPGIKSTYLKTVFSRFPHAQIGVSDSVSSKRGWMWKRNDESDAPELCLQSFWKNPQRAAHKYEKQHVWARKVAQKLSWCGKKVEYRELGWSRHICEAKLCEALPES